MLALLSRELCHRLPKPFIDNPVIGVGQDGLKATLDFMFTLRARIETGQASLNAVLNASVVTGLEVKVIVLCQTAPIAAVQHVISFKK